jgi:rhamnogalacturonyl hydrolase YesR
MKTSYLILLFSLTLSVGLRAFTPPTKTEVVSIIYKANDYWQERNPTHGNSFWNRAAYHTGNMAAYEATKDKRYYDFSYAWAERNEWKGARSDIKENWKYSYGESNDYVLFGDFQICFQVYVDLYHVQPEEFKIARAREVMEYQMSTPNKDYWWWADGLYMVMPVMTRLYKITENPLYLGKLYEYFTYADSIMYDSEAGLYYRDAKYVYPKHKTVNGLKDFWSRGSGWVFAGFARVLTDLPENDAHRPLYLQRFRAMAAALKAAQQPEGYWTRSVLDPAHAPGPETSGTAFYTFGLLWGINNGIFSMEEYGATAEKAWNYLANTALQSDGRVGFVQPIGENANPNQTVSATSTADFGVGAYLLAASEMLKMATGEMPDKIIRLTAAQMLSENQLKLTFNELLNPVSAVKMTNYSINDQPAAGFATFDGAYAVTLNLEEPLPYGKLEVKVFDLTGAAGELIESNSKRALHHDVPLSPSDPAITVTAIGNQVGNTPQNTLDNSLSTRWSQPGLNQWIQYDLGRLAKVWAVDMAFYLGNQRNSYFNIQTSVDGENFETVVTGGVSSGISTGLERYSFPQTQARYIRIVCNGNSTGGENWNSLTEVRIRYDEITGIVEHNHQKPGFFISPNPVRSGKLVINLQDFQSNVLKVSIFDVSGRRVCEVSEKAHLNQIFLDMPELQPGMYIVKIEKTEISQKAVFWVE